MFLYPLKEFLAGGLSPKRTQSIGEPTQHKADGQSIISSLYPVQNRNGILTFEENPALRAVDPILGLRLFFFNVLYPCIFFYFCVTTKGEISHHDYITTMMLLLDQTA